MRALVLEQSGQWPTYKSFDLRAPRSGEAVVSLRAAALNHRDVWISKGQYAGIQYPIVLGSDGAGTLNTESVLINPSLDWGSKAQVQGPKYRILGLPDHGTFATEVIVPRKNIYPTPSHLNFEQAAALPLAGLTAWRVLFSRCRLRKGEQVLITGIGGGVALFALQFAVAAGAKVWVTSGSDEKVARAVAMGAQGGANYRDEQWSRHLKSMAGGFDVVIDSAAGNGFASLLQLCNAAARVGIYGGTNGKINGLVPQPLFWKQVSILGSTMGNDREFAKMLSFVQQHAIVPVIDTVFDLPNGQAALEHMDNGAQFGKIILRIP